MSIETCPGEHVAVSPGLHVMAHEAHGPTAGALHEAPASAFFFAADACDFLRGWSCAKAGPQVSIATTVAIRRRFMTRPSVFGLALLRVPGPQQDA